MGFIYKLTFPSEKSYIGQTIRDIHKRLEEHQYANSSCVAVCNAIKKYGWENVKIDWYECPDEDLNFDEELLVEEMGTLAPGGYNLREGGGSTGKLSEETKQKMSEAQSGKTLSDEHKQKISKAHTGKNHTEETKEKMSKALSGEKNPMYGKTLSDETKQKLSEAMTGEKAYWYGKTLSDETKQQISEAMSGEKNPNYGKTGEKNRSSKKVYQYTIDGTYVDEYASGREAARALGKSSGSSISMCACGDRQTAYGFKWSHEKL